MMMKKVTMKLLSLMEHSSYGIHGALIPFSLFSIMSKHMMIVGSICRWFICFILSLSLNIISGSAAIVAASCSRLKSDWVCCSSNVTTLK